VTAMRKRLFASTAGALNAASEAERATDKPDITALAKKHGVEVESLTAWLDYLGIGSSAPIKLDHFTNKQMGASNYAFVNGWATGELPTLLANSSDQHVRIPGNMKPQGVCGHPTPTPP